MSNSFRLLHIVVALAGLLSLAACAMSRVDQLHNKADKVESSLKKEQSRVLALNSADRSARLDHLNSLRATLSAANVGLGAVPHLIEPAQRDVAYDVIEEVYDTIDWNIPLGPTETKRALPLQFNNGKLNLNGSAIETNSTPPVVKPSNITK